jgi:hypothetical protein
MAQDWSVHALVYFYSVGSDLPWAVLNWRLDMEFTDMKYRKKPVVIEATQWFKHGDHPKVTIMPRGRESASKGWIHTLEGGHEVTPGDYIITGVKGEHYPCKPDIFALTYEEVI